MLCILLENLGHLTDQCIDTCETRICAGHAVLLNGGQQSRNNSPTLCPGYNSLVAFLKMVATHSTKSYLLEDVLLHKLKESRCMAAEGVDSHSVLFIIMCSADKKERVSWLHETWLAWLPRQSVMLLSDGEIPGYNMTVLPPLPADSYVHQKFPSPTGYQAANLRHLKSIQWLGKVESQHLQGVDWVFMVDDDTFVNVPLLLIALQSVPASLPVLFGHIWYAPTWAESLKHLAWPSGGAGMLFSKVAFQQLASVMFTPQCEMNTFLNDVTVGMCAVKAEITKVHSVRFLPECINATYSPGVLDVGMAITMHRAVERQHMVESACIVSKRFDWPLKLCENRTVACSHACHPRL